MHGSVGSTNGGGGVVTGGTLGDGEGVVVVGVGVGVAGGSCTLVRGTQV
jgi:hypothetical protein